MEMNLELKKDQIVTCSHTFQVKIVKIYPDLDMVEFICLGTGNRELLPIKAFKKIVQILH